jgi:hypothetical protein
MSDFTARQLRILRRMRSCVAVHGEAPSPIAGVADVLTGGCTSRRRFPMAETEFPDDLRAAQIRLHQATAELAALCRILPWSVEPMPGRPGTEHPHTGEVTGARKDSPGWSEEQKQAVKRLRMECIDLSIRIATHPYWQTVEAKKQVDTRQALRTTARTVTAPAIDVTEAA